MIEEQKETPRRITIKQILITIGVVGAIAGGVMEHQNIESEHTRDEARLENILRWSTLAREGIETLDDTSATTVLRKALRNAAQTSKRWEKVGTELHVATGELRYAEAQRGDALTRTIVDDDDKQRIEQALKELENAGKDRYTRHGNTGITVETPVRIAFIAVIGAWAAIGCTVLLTGIGTLIALFGLDLIEKTQRWMRNLKPAQQG